MGRIYLAIITMLIGVIATLVIHIKGLWIIPGLEDTIKDCVETVSGAKAEGEKAVAVSGAIAKGEGTSHAQNSAVTAIAARDFIARQRLRPEVSRPASGGAALSGGAGPAPAVPELDPGSDPAPLPPEPGPGDGWVAVKEEDVLICTADFELAWTGYTTWQRLKAEGLAQPVTPAFPAPSFDAAQDEREPQP